MNVNDGPRDVDLDGVIRPFRPGSAVERLAELHDVDAVLAELD
jgi:hypothetical protein